MITALLVSLFICMTASDSLAGKWSDFVIVKEHEGISFSFHKRQLNDGWFAEWKAENLSQGWGSPESSLRIYTCSNGKKQKIEEKL